MRQYVEFLNKLDAQGRVNLDGIEVYWIDRVNEFFDAKPFKIKLDSSHGLRAVVRDTIEQDQKRQRGALGTYHVGAVLQHLVGAKLECVQGKGSIEHNSFSTADDPRNRVGDFLLGDVPVHVTASPNEGVVAKCLENLNEGYHPILVTLQPGTIVAQGLAENIGIADRVDIFEIEQFVALNLYEIGKFGAEGRKTAVSDLVENYNDIIDEVETDPSLKIELGRLPKTSKQVKLSGM